MEGLEPLSDCRRLLVIPARLHSTRLPEKLLLRESGKSILQHTYEAALQATCPDGVVVAVDDPLLMREVESFGGIAAMTRPDHASGTDRVAEVVASLPQVACVVNLQGDEPEINPADIDHLFNLLDAHPNTGVATLATPIRERRVFEDPSCVKVVFDSNGKAMYFSRSPIPHVRDWDSALLAAEPALFHQHVGIYAYRRWPLLRLAETPQGQAEQLEKLEQLRILEQGDTIAVGVIQQAAQGIDTPADYQAFLQRQLHASTTDVKESRAA